MPSVADCEVMRDLILSLAVMAIHRGLLLRNRIFGLPYPIYGGATAEVERCSIEVEGTTVHGSLVLPRECRPTAGLLLLHGIGETVEHWEAVQQIFATEGIASLVVDYRGFGRSGWWFSTGRAELDALTAFRYLEGRLPGLALSLVGFSLGCGVAATVCQRTGPKLLVLCAGYPTLRKAARAIGLPAAMTWLLRDVWCPEEVLRRCEVPVLIVHGEEDRLFPPGLARSLSVACTSPCELHVVGGVSHDDPIFRPGASFWGPVVERVKALPVEEVHSSGGGRSPEA